MVHGTVQKKADTQQTIRPNHLLSADYRKTQLHDRLQDLESDYLQNLKHLQKVAKKAYHRYTGLNQ